MSRHAPRLSRRPLVGHDQDRPLRVPGLPPAGNHLPLLRQGYILRPPTALASRALEHLCYNLRREDSRLGLARLYEFKLQPGEFAGIHAWEFSGVVLCLSDCVGHLEGDRGDGGGVDGGGQFVEGWGVEMDELIDRSMLTRVTPAVVVEWLGEGGPVEGTSGL